jgi:hypothetical protein
VRGVIDTDASLCVSLIAFLLFLSCTCFGLLWPLVQFWIGFDGVDHQDISDPFMQFTNYTGGLKIAEVFSSADLTSYCLDFME